MTVRNVLLTGATGVVGSALLPRLRDHRVISLTHRGRCPGPAVRGDVAAPRLGVDAATYDRLAEVVDTVVHCAAVTDFAMSAERTDGTNVRGTDNILSFARDAGARLIYVSTAFVERAEQAARSARTAMPGVPTAKSYVDSKVEAERRVRRSGLPVVIARPSIVTGDSGTGWAPRPQGLATMVGAALDGHLPALLPGSPRTFLDLIPRDVVAAALAALVDSGQVRGEYWLTAGAAALSLPRVIELTAETARDAGIGFKPYRLLAPRTAERLAACAPADPARAEQHRRLAGLLAMVHLFDEVDPFPTSLGRIPSGPPAPTAAEVEDSYRAMVRHLLGGARRSRRPAPARAK